MSSTLAATDFSVDLVFSPEVLVVAATRIEDPAFRYAVHRNGRSNFYKRVADWYITRDLEASDADLLSEFAGRMCYQSWHRPNPDTATNKGYITNIFNNRHFSVLEHASVTVAISGISRSLSHELVRHRHFSFSQLSQRYVDQRTLRFVVHPRIKRAGQEAIDKLVHVVRETVRVYSELIEIAKNSDDSATRKQIFEAARSVLPNCVETRLVMTGNHRAWFEFLLKRLSKSADEEMQVLAKVIYLSLYPYAPSLYSLMPEELIT